MNKCKLCDKKTRPIYTSKDYKIIPVCLDCYRNNRPPAKNDYKKLMNKLAKMGYVWILNIGDESCPFTFFGLDVSFFQIVQYFFKFIEANNYSLQSQDDFTFNFHDYSDPIIVETYISFINEEDGSTYSISIKMGKYNYKENTILYFTDKQLGNTVSDLDNYSYYLINKDKTLEEIIPDFDKDYIPENEYDESRKEYFSENDLEELIGFYPNLED